MTLSRDESLNIFSECFCVPVSIIVTFSLFQYLVTVFYSRRHDPHVRVLLIASFLSFATLIPFAYPNDEQVRNLNDMSEVCSVLTFTQQIAILVRGVNKKMKLQSLVVLGRIAELLVLLGLTMLVVNVIQIVEPNSREMTVIELIDHIIEYAAVSFVVCFRFYFLSLVRGWTHIFQHQKLELFYYLLFFTHSVVFHAVQETLDVDIYHIKGLWMRITIALCLWPTIRAKMSQLSSLTGSKGMTSVADGRSRNATNTKNTVNTVIIADKHNADRESELVEPYGPGKLKLIVRKQMKMNASIIIPAKSSKKRGPRRLMQQLGIGTAGVVLRLSSATGSFHRRFSISRRSSTRVTAMPRSTSRS